MITNYRNLREKDDLTERYLQNLSFQEELNNMKERANIRRWLDMPVEIERPKGPEKPKEKEDTYDIRERLITKLRPSFLNNKELVSFTEKLEDLNQLDILDDEFNLFKRDFIGNSRRLTADRAMELFESFKGRRTVFKDTPKLLSDLKDFTTKLVEPKSEPQKISVLGEMSMGQEVPIAGRSALDVLGGIDEEEEMKEEEMKEEEMKEEDVDEEEKVDKSIIQMIDPKKKKPQKKELIEIGQKRGLKLNKSMNWGKLAEALFNRGIVAYNTETMRPIDKDEYEKIMGSGMRRRGNRCWRGFKPVRGMKPYSRGSCVRLMGAGLVKGVNNDNMVNIPFIDRNELFRRMIGTGWE